MRLPRYVLAKRQRDGRIAYYFNPPMWARKKGCTLASEALGVDYESMRQRAELILLPAFDSWLNGGLDGKIQTVEPGTLQWLFDEFRKTWTVPTAKRMKPLSPGQCRVHETGLRLLS
jgi:hypothetical protein